MTWIFSACAPLAGRGDGSNVRDFEDRPSNYLDQSKISLTLDCTVVETIKEAPCLHEGEVNERLDGGVLQISCRGLH
jgi:hypothetical protein